MFLRITFAKYTYQVKDMHTPATQNHITLQVRTTVYHQQQSTTCITKQYAALMWTKRETRLCDTMFQAAGRRFCNGLPSSLRHHNLSMGQFGNGLKTQLFAEFHLYFLFCNVPCIDLTSTTIHCEPEKYATLLNSGVTW